MSVLVLGSAGEYEYEMCVAIAEATKAIEVTIAHYDSTWSAEGADVVILTYPSRQERSLDIVREARAGKPVVVVERPHEQLATMFLSNAVEEVVFDNELALLPRAISRARVRREATALIERAARVDPLTELLNRRGIGDLIPRLCSRYVEATAVLIDIDDFKDVNTRHGHAEGDKLLRRLADIVRDSVRPTDVAARTGGDEFVILLPATNPNDAGLVIERLRCALRDGGIAASFGIADAHGAGSLDELISRTQSCLAASKSSGKNKLTVRTASGELIVIAAL